MSTSAARRAASAAQRAAKTAPSLTQEAIDLLEKTRGGNAIPLGINNNLRRILEENGVEVTSTTTAQEAIAQLRKKQAKQNAAQRIREKRTGKAKPGGGVTPGRRVVGQGSLEVNARRAEHMRAVRELAIEEIAKRIGVPPGALTGKNAEALGFSPADLDRAIQNVARDLGFGSEATLSREQLEAATDRVFEYMALNTKTLPEGQSAADPASAKPDAPLPIREQFDGAPTRREAIERYLESVKEQRRREGLREYRAPDETEFKEMGPAGSMTAEQASSVAGRRPGNFNDMGPRLSAADRKRLRRAMPDRPPPRILEVSGSLGDNPAGDLEGTGARQRADSRQDGPAPDDVGEGPLFGPNPGRALPEQQFSAPPPDASSLRISRITRNSGPSLGFDEPYSNSFGNDLDIPDDRAFTSVVERRFDPSTGEVKESLVEGDLVSIGDQFFFRDRASGQIYQFDAADQAPRAISDSDYRRTAFAMRNNPTQPVTQLTFPEDQGFRARAYESSTDSFGIPEFLPDEIFAELLGEAAAAMAPGGGSVNLANLRRVADELEIRLELDGSRTRQIVGQAFGDAEAGLDALASLRKLSESAGRLAPGETPSAPGNLRTVEVGGRQIVLDEEGMLALNKQLEDVRKEADGLRGVLEADPAQLSRMSQRVGPLDEDVPLELESNPAARAANRYIRVLNQGSPEMIRRVQDEIRARLDVLERTDLEIRTAFQGAENIDDFARPDGIRPETARFVRDGEGWRRLGDDPPFSQQVLDLLEKAENGEDISLDYDENLRKILRAYKVRVTPRTTPQEAIAELRSKFSVKQQEADPAGLDVIEVSDSPDMAPGDDLLTDQAKARNAPTPGTNLGLSQVRNLVRKVFTSQRGSEPGMRTPTALADLEARPKASRVPSQERINQMRDELKELEDAYYAIPFKKKKARRKAFIELERKSRQYANEAAGAADSKYATADAGAREIAALSGVRQGTGPEQLETGAPGSAGDDVRGSAANKPLDQRKTSEEIYATLLGVDEAAVRDQWARLDPDQPEPADITSQERMAREAISARYTGDNKVGQLAAELIAERLNPGSSDKLARARNTLESLQRQARPLESMVDEGGGMLGSARRYLMGSSVPYSPGALRQIGRSLMGAVPGSRAWTARAADYDALMTRRAADVTGRIGDLRKQIQRAEAEIGESSVNAFADPRAIEAAIAGPEGARTIDERLLPEERRSPAFEGAYKLLDEIRASGEPTQEMRDRAALAMREIQRYEQQLNRPGFGGDASGMRRELNRLREDLSVESGLEDTVGVPRKFTLNKETLEPTTDSPAAPKPTPTGDLADYVAYDFAPPSMRIADGTDEVDADLPGRFKYFESKQEADAVAAMLRGEMPSVLPQEIQDNLDRLGVALNPRMLNQSGGLNPRFAELESGERVFRVDLPITGQRGRTSVTVEVPVMRELPMPETGKTRVFRLDTEEGVVTPRVRDADKLEARRQADVWERSMFGMQIDTSGFRGDTPDPDAPDYTYEGTPFSYEDAPANRMPSREQPTPRRAQEDGQNDVEAEMERIARREEELAASRTADDPSYYDEIDDPNDPEVARPTRSSDEVLAEQSELQSKYNRVRDGRNPREPGADSQGGRVRRAVRRIIPGSAVVGVLAGMGASSPAAADINVAGGQGEIEERLARVRGSRAAVPVPVYRYGTTQNYSPAF